MIYPAVTLHTDGLQWVEKKHTRDFVCFRILQFLGKQNKSTCQKLIPPNGGGIVGLKDPGLSLSDTISCLKVMP